MGFPTPAFSRISWLKFWCGQQRLELLNPCECVCHQCTKVYQWQVKTPELMHLFLLDMGVSSQPACEACIVHHWTDELLIQRKSISDGDHSQSLSHFLPHLIDTRQPGQLCIKGHPMNGLCWPSGLVPWRGVLVGVWGCAYQPLRTALQDPLRW